jgi:TRAP transporter 4TM/12TM fusion protein
MYLTTDGIYGIPLGTSATMVVMFILFGAFLYKSGAGKFFMDLACSLSGKSRGGPAKIAVFASAFFGTISGAAVANVYATGTFTIPLMKRIGYRPQFAGAVEAAASTGGQLMPPVMGSAAFIMAEILGVSYLEVMKAAILPAILYFGCCLFTVHFEALKYNLGSLMGEEIPSLKKTLGRSYMLFAPMAIIFMLVLGYTPSMSALAGTFITILISLPNKKFRIGPNRFIQCLQEGAKGAIMVAVATAAAGLIVGVAAKVGLGFKVTNVVMDLSGGFLLLGSILIMIATIIMGMGVPTTAAYIMVAALGAPILIKMGVIPMAAHMFVFYYACISTVTPPVALSAYAGASIANSEPFRTGFTAFRLAIAGFIVPFMFVYSPALLLNGNLLECMIAGVSAFLGCLALAGSLQGWFWGKATIVPRGMLLVSALALIHTSFRTDVIGICLIFIVLLWQWIAKRKESAQFFLSKQTKFLR